MNIDERLKLLAQSTKALHESVKEFSRQMAARDNPALYEAAKQTCHQCGLPWIDPRTGKNLSTTTQAEKEKEGLTANP